MNSGLLLHGHSTYRNTYRGRTYSSTYRGSLQNRRNFFAYFRRTETKARRARGEEREKNNQLGSQVHIWTPEQLEQWYAYRRYFFRALPLVRARLAFASVRLKYAKKITPVLQVSIEAAWPNGQRVGLPVQRSPVGAPLTTWICSSVAPSSNSWPRL